MRRPFCHASTTLLPPAIERIRAGQAWVRTCCTRLMARQSSKNTDRQRRRSLLRLALVGLIIASLTGVAHARPTKAKVILVNGKDTVLTVTQYELALVQVMAEMCPPMLNRTQKVQFIAAYQNQLAAFLPNAINPHETLRQLNTQQEYRSVLRNVRAWTAKFPASENKALCQEFAQSTHTF